MGSPWPCVVADTSTVPSSYTSPVTTNFYHHNNLINNNNYSAFVSIGQEPGLFCEERVSSNSSETHLNNNNYVELNRNYAHLYGPRINQNLKRQLAQYMTRSGSFENGELAKKRLRGNCVLTVREIPSWNIYFHDQKRHLADFSDIKKGISHDNSINKRVSLCFYKNVMTKLNVDALVSSTNETFSGLSGVDKLVHDEAGKALNEVCGKFPRCGVGNVQLTQGFQLPSRYIIHVNGPDYRDPQYEFNLERSYENCLNLLLQQQLRTIAFPCISTGRKCVPKNLAAQVALSTIRRFLEQHKDKIDRIVFCLHNKKDIDIYVRLMQIYFPVD